MPRKSVFILGALAVIVLIVAGGIIVIWRFYLAHRYEQDVISENIEIGQQWTEIEPPKPLKIEKQKQFVAIEVEPPFSAWKGLGITTPTGELINPEIKIFGKNGFECDLKYYEGTRVKGLINGTEYAEYICKNGLSGQTEIQKIMLRSETPIPVKRIVWSGSNPEDRE